MKLLRYLLVSLVMLGTCRYRAHADDIGPLLHWKLDDGVGAAARDASGHGIAGVVGGVWTASESGGAALLDGTPRTAITAQLPAAYRLGAGSWTVMAWVKPKKFTIDDPQNQRRLFAYGAYPQSYLCVDILSQGSVSLYQTYQLNGKSIAEGLESSTNLTLGNWAHVAAVYDKKARLFRIYINGRLRGERRTAPDFSPDLSISGEFTVGNGWHNFDGVAEDVWLYSRALPQEEIRAQFARLKTVLNVVPTPAEAQADARETVQKSMAAANQALDAGDYANARAALASVVSNSEAPAGYCGYAALRTAQSLADQGRLSEARAAYVRIAANSDYPEVHRFEASEIVQELDRRARGLSPRDPAASHIQLPAISKIRRRIYVAANGSDANPGTEQRPLATLTAARDHVRADLKGPGLGAVEVLIAPGRYLANATLTLTNEDSGTANAPVIYRAAKPGAVSLYGGARLTGFTPVVDPSILSRLPVESRGKVLQRDLKTQGITDYGALAVRGFGQPTPPPTLELYVNGRPMTLARWPNEGFVFPTRLVDPGSRPKGEPSVLAYEGDRPSRWAHAEDAWMFGYFHWLWADATAKIAKIDTVQKTITTAEPYDYGGGGMSAEQGIKFYVFNLLEEIDVPGEWYLDRSRGILYLYPPVGLHTAADLEKSGVEISMLSSPMVAAKGLSHVRFEGLTFDLARGDGIVLEDCSDCAIADCTVSRMAANGIRVLGGMRDVLLGCDVHTIGRRATEVIGGDRATLTPGGHIVANCRIHDFGRIDRTYTPGVQLEGVGNHVTHNLFYDCPSSAMRIEGNDHLIDYNEFHDVLRESDDQGAIDMFGNPTYRGVVFRYNYFHQIGSGKTQKLSNGQAGIRLDDTISGVRIYGNIFYQSANGAFGGVQMNSGRDNVIDNNIFADSPHGITGGYSAGNGIWRQIRSGSSPAEFITNALYVKRYPTLATMLQEPAYNHVWRNIFYHIDQVDRSYAQGTLDMLANGIYSDAEPGFADAAHGDFRLKSGAPVLNALGFRPIPVDEIGLYSESGGKN